MMCRKAHSVERESICLGQHGLHGRRGPQSLQGPRVNRWPIAFSNAFSESIHIVKGTGYRVELELVA